MARDLQKVFSQFAVTAFFCGLLPVAVLAQDPPSRVARLNYLSGAVSMEPAGTDGWTSAVINRPLTTDDYLWTDRGARAELHLDNSVLRLNSETSFGFLNLDDRTVQIKLAQGELDIHLRDLDQGEGYEIDTPNAAVSLVQPGDYRIVINPDDQTSTVIVRRGDAEITGGGQTFSLPGGQSARLVGEDSMSYDVQPAPAPDAFEEFCERRDQAEMRAAQQARYVPAGVVGYEDLDNYGAWNEAPGYGYVWYPRVNPGWAPYRMGHWAWIEPWGWTWVDDAAWGFAPFHYGRWAFVGGRWGWCPGPVRVRPVYAPALVAFVGGSNFSVSASFGRGPAVGWVPLGPGEVYAPAYHVSPTYFRQVNVANTVVNRNVNITNVYNNYYVNRTNVNIRNVNTTLVNTRINNAVTVMPREAFATGRPVNGSGRALPPNEVARLQNTGYAITPGVAPTRQALAPEVRNISAARPPAGIQSTQVVAQRTPPPRVVPFAARQQILQQNDGRPLTIEQLHQMSARQPSTSPGVRMVGAPAVQRRAVEAPANNSPIQAQQPAARGQFENRPTAVTNPGNRAPVTQDGQPERGVRPVNPGNAAVPNAGANRDQQLRQQQMRERQQVQQQQVQQQQLQRQQVQQQQIEQQRQSQQQRRQPDQQYRVEQQRQQQEQQIRQQQENQRAQQEVNQQRMRQQQQLEQQRQQQSRQQQQERREPGPVARPGAQPRESQVERAAPRESRGEQRREERRPRDDKDK